MPVYQIYYESREFAREIGDPCLGEVTAETPEEALEKVWKNTGEHSHLARGAGLLVIERERLERNRRVFRDGGRGR